MWSRPWFGLCERWLNTLFRGQHIWESGPGVLVPSLNTPVHPPGVPIPLHARLWDTSHPPKQQKGDNQPGLFSGYFFFPKQNLAYSKACLGTARAPWGQFPTALRLLRPSWRRHLGPPIPSAPSPCRGRLGQGLFIDTAPSSLPLPEETAPGGDSPDLAVLVAIPPGMVLSGNRRPPASPSLRGAGSPTVASLEESQSEVN